MILNFFFRKKHFIFCVLTVYCLVFIYNAGYANDTTSCDNAAETIAVSSEFSITNSSVVNLIFNAGFESGGLNSWGAWEPGGTATVVSDNAYEGTYALRLQGGETSVEQVVTGLIPNTTYTFSGFGKKTNVDAYVVIGVKDYGGGQVTSPFTSTSYAEASLEFTTGSTNTTAKIFFYAPPSGVLAYGDDFRLDGIREGDLPAGTYYIDATNGNDDNDGLSASTAWQTIAKVNTSNFSPGTTLLFHCGDTWNEQLKPSRSGTVDSINVINMYGDCNSDADKPHIATNGSFQIGIHLYNIAYWEVNNFQVSNDTPTGIQYTGAQGVRIELNNFGTANHIYVRDCYIHDIDGNNDKGSSGDNGLREGHGIFWTNSGTFISVFNDLRIENNTLERVDRNGIKGDGYWDRTNWHPSTNVVIRGNTLTDIGGDGIVVIATDGALVEYNVLRYFRMRPPLDHRDCSAGIWCWSADNTLFQYNESAFGWGKDNWGCDAQGYDADANCVGSIFQYNYSHDNDGGFTLIINYEEDAPASVKLDNTIFRYNISENDGVYKKRLIQMTGAYDNCEIYNNIFYMGAGVDINVFEMGTWPDGYPLNTTFTNNIFYLDNGATAIYSAAGMANLLFDNNVFYGSGHNNLTSIIPNPLTVNPLLSMPGMGVDINNLEGYQLESNSPVIDAGTNIPGYAGTDFWGGLVPQNNQVDIGVHEANLFCPFARVMDSIVEQETQIIQAENSVSSKAIIMGASDVVYTAGAFILLEAGFSVAGGSQFFATISACDPLVNLKENKELEKGATMHKDE